MLNNNEYENLIERMRRNANEAKEIRDFISETDKNLFNDNNVIDWQDMLNDISITRECDIIS